MSTIAHVLILESSWVHVVHGGLQRTMAATLTLTVSDIGALHQNEAQRRFFITPGPIMPTVITSLRAR